MAKSSTLHEMHPFLSNDPRWALVQRIASSQHLKTSLRLHDFLLYVGECAIRGVPEEATEQQIGIHVFDRAPGYNSSEDSIVRTHARLLRQKLADYFVGEGSNEDMILEIPKGHYLPVFRSRASRFRVRDTPDPARTDAPVPPEAADASYAVPKYSSARLWNLGLGFIVLALLAALCFQLWGKGKPQTDRPTNAAIETFWGPFLSGSPPLVIYSNALFVGNSKDGLRYAPSKADQAPSGIYTDTYTGVGEVAAVYQLTRLFDAHDARFILKRSLLVTWDQASLKNLIFIGSRAENPSLKVLPNTTDFTMTSSPDSAGIVNHHPKPGEPPVYSRPEHPLTKDYAILALLPGVQPGKWVLICSGLTTFGTQAAVNFVSTPDTLEKLLRAAHFPHGTIRPFEAVLETTVAGGVPIEPRLVTLRTH